MNNIKKVCLELFEARNYTIIEQDDNTILGSEENGSRIYLCILPELKLNINTIKYYYRFLLEEHIPHAILIYNSVITSSVKKILSNINIDIELFSQSELTFNITKHILVPEHKLIDKQDGVDYTKYPIIKKTDPVCKFFRFRPGQLIQIIRRNKSLYYRIVK